MQAAHSIIQELQQAFSPEDRTGWLIERKQINSLIIFASQIEQQFKSVIHCLTIYNIQHEVSPINLPDLTMLVFY